MLTRTQALRFRAHLDSIINSLEDDAALDVSDLFPGWQSGKNYYGPNNVSHPQSRVQYSGVLYKCLQDHFSQDDWTPNTAVSLWVRVDNPAEEWPEWVQPLGAQDAYELGAQVSHNDKHWISNVNDNVWEPGVYGWDEVTNE